MANTGVDAQLATDLPTGLLTCVEAAQLLGVTPSAIQQAISRGALHPLKLPRRRHKYLRREELLRYQGIGRHGRPVSDGTGRLPEDTAARARQDLLDVLRFVFLAAGAAWSANAAAMRDATVAAHQQAAATVASIGETVIATVDRCLATISTLGTDIGTPRHAAGVDMTGNADASPGSSGDDASAATRSHASPVDASSEAGHRAPVQRETSAASDVPAHFEAFAQAVREGISRAGALSEEDDRALRHFAEWARALG